MKLEIFDKFLGKNNIGDAGQIAVYLCSVLIINNEEMINCRVGGTFLGTICIYVIISCMNI